MASEEIAGLRFVRLRDPRGGVRVGFVAGDEVGVLETDDVVATLEADSLPGPVESVPIVDPQSCTPAPPWTQLAPLIPPETWAAGVTYLRSRSIQYTTEDWKRYG